MSSITYFLALLVIAAVSNSELICPGFGFIRPNTPCTDTCSQDNDNCGSGMKCCYSPVTPCGYNCVVGKLNIPRSGSCPSQDSNQTDSNWFLCDANFCDVDSDCKCSQKCCSNLCGSKICIKRVKKTTKT